GAAALGLPTGLALSPPASPADGSTSCGWGAGRPGDWAGVTACAVRWEPCDALGELSATTPAAASNAHTPRMIKRVRVLAIQAFRPPGSHTLVAPRRTHRRRPD